MTTFNKILNPMYLIAFADPAQVDFVSEVG